MGEVRLATLARLVDLLEDDVVVGAVEGTPGGDGIGFTQEREARFLSTLAGSGLVPIR